MKERVGWQPVLQVSETSINKQETIPASSRTLRHRIQPVLTYHDSIGSGVRYFFSLLAPTSGLDLPLRGLGRRHPITAQSSFMEGVSEGARAVCHAGVRSPKWVTYRKSYLEQIWSALPQIADVDCGGEDFSAGPLADIVAAGGFAARGQKPSMRSSFLLTGSAESIDCALRKSAIASARRPSTS